MTPRHYATVPLLLAAAANAWSWSLVEPEELQPADLAVLQSGQSRADFACQVAADKPDLGFDLRFHSDYRATVPIKVLETSGGGFQVLMRVTPARESKKAVYIAHRFAVREFPHGLKGEGIIDGGFNLGLGQYRVDWMMRDGNGRVCSSHWALEAKLRASQQNFPLALRSNTATDWSTELSDDRPPPPRKPLRLKILLNLSPSKPWRSMLDPGDIAAILSMLRSLTRGPDVSSFTIVAFNLREQKILYESDASKTVDFEGLLQSLQKPTAGTIEYRLLKDPHGETNFATELLASRLGAESEAADAIVILGAKVTLDKKIPLDRLRAAGALQSPVYYFNYNPDPIDDPFRDTIGSALKAYPLAVSYNIGRPADFGVAMRDLRMKQGSE